ncbi:MAG: MFS transporter [Chitinophagaceae bacterium]
MSKAPKGIWKVIGASSAGTLIEWYDFYIFGSLAAVISTKFFPQDNPTAAFLSTLATFAAGFVVRPFGALVFGRLGDMIGRKYTFMLTLLLMGGATFLIGCIPSYETIGFWAPFLVLLLRLLQGLALGGEYGGAATYVAEHAPVNRRGYWTAWIQTTASTGLLVSLIVILITRKSLSVDAFDQWGWRVPFWISIVMVIISYFIRKGMHESPEFAKAKKEGTLTKNPLKESFGNRYNLKYVLLALFGAAMGQGVIFYTSQFYTQSYLGKVCGLDAAQTDSILAIAILVGSPFFVVFGALSDRIGRKTVLLAGMLLAVLLYRPIFGQMYQLTQTSEKGTPRVEIKPSSTATHPNGDQIAKFETLKTFSDGTILTKDSTVTTHTQTAETDTKVAQSIQLSTADEWKMIGLLFILVLFVTITYGPIAAFLVEMFPVNIRYTSMSLPYHIGNGIFGGLMPTVAVYLVSKSKEAGDAHYYLEGLWYPIILSTICFVIGLVYINGKKSLKLNE